MKTVDMIVTAPHFYTMRDTGVGYHADCGMAVEAGRIADLGPATDILAAYRADRVIHAASHAVLPGFIDAHMHMTDGLLRGLAQDTRNWMMHGIGPFQYEIGPRQALLGCQLVVMEALRAGTTTFGEFSNYDEEICRFMAASGVRCRMTIRIRDAEERIYEPGELYVFNPEKGEKMTAACLAAHDKWHGAADGRLTILFGPQGPDFVSRERLLKIRQLAIERGSRVHMHVQQGDRETAQIVKRYDRRPIAFLDELGYLDDHLIAVHLTDANDTEAALAARRGASMILCSGSIGIIDGIVPPAKAFQDAGGRVALGSDQAPGNNCHNIFNEMKLTALFNKIKYGDPAVMPAWRALRMATIEGAEAFGLANDVGSLEPGKRADFIIVNLNTPTMSPVYTDPMRNIVPNLVYSARGDEVSITVVDGRILYENGRYHTIDAKTVLSTVQDTAKEIGAKGAETFWKVNGSNAGFMRDGRL